MSLGFILGGASRNHQLKDFEQLAKWLDEDGEGSVYYIVPNHIKFEAEVSALKHMRQHCGEQGRVFASSRLQVLSFTRLAWYFMKGTPAYQVPRIGAAGVNMIIYRILRDLKDELQLFSGEEAQPGFITQLGRQMMELQNGCIAPEDVTAMYEKLPQGRPGAESILKAKLHDLALVYGMFVERTSGRFLANTEILTELAQYLDTVDLSGSRFLISGFNRLTARELAVVERMIANAGEVRVDLVLDHPYTDAPPEPGNLFYRPGNLYWQLCRHARKTGARILFDSYADRMRVNGDLARLEKYWVASSSGFSGSGSEELEEDAVRIYGARNREEELKFVAAQIRRMVALEGYRYRDFLVLTRHLNLYGNILQPVFAKAEVPVFVDLQKKVSDHPLVELLNALFAVRKHYYRYNDMMRLLKTELLIPEGMSVSEYRGILDRTENLILKSGYEGGAWLREQDWIYYRFGQSDFGTRTDAEDEITREVNLIRNYVKRTLPPFFEELDKSGNGREAAVCLMKFLQENGVMKRLEEWRAELMAEDRLQESERPEQVWNLFCRMMDEFVTNLGDLPFEEEDFINLLQTGFDAGEYSRVPAALDGVSVSETGMVQPSDRKVVFMIGTTDLVMPDRIQNTSLLSDGDRSLMAERELLSDDQMLDDTSEKVMQAEPFLNYLAFLAPTERLVFTYPHGDGNDGGMKLSPYVERIRQHFSLEERRITDEERISTPKGTVEDLIFEFRRHADGHDDVPGFWREVRNVMERAEPEMTERIMGSLFYRNIPEQLTAENAQKLYGSELNTSISKIETFYQNPYEYFLKFGLGLQERDVFEMSVADTGSYFHAVLDCFFRLLKKNGLTLGDLSREQFDEIFRETAETVSADPQFMILKSSNRMGFIGMLLNDTLFQTLWAVHGQRGYGHVRTVRTEALFGHVGVEQGLSGLSWETPGRHRVNVRGKIDRIDEMTGAGRNFLGVIDYKSGDRRFSYSQAYYGLALQLLTYINALEENAAEVLPDTPAEMAGALYMHLKNPRLKPAEVKEDAQRTLLASHGYQGLLVSDPDLLSALDETVEEKQSSLFLPFARLKDGSYRKSDSLVATGDLDLLIRHNRRMIENACDMILDGRIDLYPAKWGSNVTALQYSPFKSVMQFDAMLPENRYFIIPTLRADEVLKLVREEQDD